jgi:hypothetical protein
MPSQHAYPPISYRPPEHVRAWLTGFATRHDRPVRAIITEALEEYRARHDKEGTHGMQMLSTEVARDYLRRAFTYNFMQPDQPAWAPVSFPGITHSSDGTLSSSVKAQGTRHLIEVLRGHGCVIRFSNGADVVGALHHVLWDQWTKEEIGNGRFTGRLFDNYGGIYHGCTALDAARYSAERLAALTGGLYSYTVQQDSPQ